MNNAPRITKRRRQVLDLLAQGYTDQAIGRQLHLAPLSISGHIRRCRQAFLLANDRKEKHPRWALAVWWLETRAALKLAERTRRNF